jgi:hypothetical protein
MAKPQLIELVQDILSEADSDNVSQLSDTVESEQCARIIRDAFRTIVDVYDVKLSDQIQQLDATSTTTPAAMTRPAGMYNIQSVRYDQVQSIGGDPIFQNVPYVTAEDFINRTSNRTLSDTTTQAMVIEGHSVLIKNDRAPTCFTILGGYDTLVFDAVNLALETNLQSSKSIVYGTIKPELSLTTGATIDLPEGLFTCLRDQARVRFFELYKDGAPREMVRAARHSEVRAQRMRRITKNPVHNNTGPNYGRK